MTLGLPLVFPVFMIMTHFLWEEPSNPAAGTGREGDQKHNFVFCPPILCLVSFSRFMCGMKHDSLIGFLLSQMPDILYCTFCCLLLLLLLLFFVYSQPQSIPPPTAVKKWSVWCTQIALRWWRKQIVWIVFLKIAFINKTQRPQCVGLWHKSIKSHRAKSSSDAWWLGMRTPNDFWRKIIFLPSRNQRTMIHLFTYHM